VAQATEIIRGDLGGFNGLLLKMMGTRLVIRLCVEVDPEKPADTGVKLADLLRSLKAA
jgi:hypothetical protein